MKDYLLKLCIDMNIKLIYTEGDYTGLSVGIKNDRPFIKVNSLFKECPEEIAKAIIEYYTGCQYEYKNFQVLKDYIEDNVITAEYIISPPDETFKSIFIKHTELEAASKEKITNKKASKGKTAKRKKSTKGTFQDKIPKDDKSSLVELNNSSVSKKGFCDNTPNIKPDESIKVPNDDVVELDVVVDNPIQ